MDKPEKIRALDDDYIRAISNIPIKETTFPGASYYSYYSLSLFLSGSILALFSSAILLRLDLFVLGIIPFVITGYVILAEHRMVTALRKSPLKGLAWPHEGVAFVGRKVSVKISLENSLPLNIGEIRCEIRTCPGFYSKGRFITHLNANSTETFNIDLIPLRPGKAMFYGLSIIVTSPFGFRPRRYYLLLPVVFNINSHGFSHFRAKNKWALDLYEKRAAPTLHGDFAYLRDYLPGDPYKSIVKSISIKRKKPVVLLSYPEKTEKWALIIDVSPQMFSGIPGYSQFDQLSNILPFIIKKLRKSEHEVMVILYTHKVEEVLEKVKPSTIISTLAKYRYAVSPDSIELNSDLVTRLSEHLAWNYGFSLSIPEVLEGESKEQLEKQVRKIIQRIPLAKGIERPKLKWESLNELIIILASLTGLELSSFKKMVPAINSAIDKGISKFVQNIVVFSNLESDEIDSTELIKRLHVASKRRIDVNFMIYDEDYEQYRPFGDRILKKKLKYKLGNLFNDILSTKSRFTFWNPTFPVFLNNLFNKGKK